MGGFSADMGAHAIYVWPAYGAAALILLGLILWVRAAGKRAEADLRSLEQARGPRK